MGEFILSAMGLQYICIVFNIYTVKRKGNILKGNRYIFKGAGRGQLCQNYFCLPTEMWFTLKGKNLLLLGANSFSKRTKFFLFRVDPLFRRGLVYRNE